MGLVRSMTSEVHTGPFDSEIRPCGHRRSGGKGPARSMISEVKTGLLDSDIRPCGPGRERGVLPTLGGKGEA